MISVVIPTLDAERSLTACLTALLPAALEGLVREVVIADGGSHDATIDIADDAGAEIVRTSPGRGTQLAAGARQAKGPWLLFLHADTVLAPGWDIEARRFLDNARLGPDRVAAFRFALDDNGFRPRLLERLVALRSRLLALPYGDQGLLIKKETYDHLGGFADIPLMEDVDLMRRIGRRRLHLLAAQAHTDAERYQRDGYLRRSLRNLSCLGLYYAGVAPEKIARRYEA